MAYQARDGQGALFIKKGATLTLEGDEASKRPVMDGYLMIKGEKVQLACWLKRGKGGFFLSVSVDTWEPMKKDSRGMPVVEDSDIEF